ncbi:putative membrane protein [Clostridium argentinense CDC 2741]|uniref:Putative membrane protein n=2 Tax=Clostridium argentinense TaxID=29341 RepID=A0A0C1U0T9_9CLOT|nr:hypothetical protein [Clostridium argentinense]ARC85895.1 hypothetical protein RSJ17_16035 [Clostridium argentinense]KIE46459.1 putative membrane protein [Clostridium argentinense CDC 2741]NFP48615.1 hypothetical protein [Clostridium argentinense]NFP71117.1 hypothetical protein [Clostridium argentinense]NFP75867.1 hypothetical protein [Clostridium argentinense]
MQAIMEPIFHVVYLTTVITLGSIMIKNSKDNKYFKLFGYMSLILGIGDSFHLIPRIYALLTTGLEANAASLGFGKFVTSITMTIFYVILYRIWKLRFNIKEVKALDISIYLLALIRIALCLFPQNDWLNYYAPVSWGIYRNIPFTIMGIIMIYIIYKEATKVNDKDYKYMALAVLLSFALYTPVVLWATTNRLIGMLMIPKTLAYVWIVLIGYKQFKKYLFKSK